MPAFAAPCPRLSPASWSTRLALATALTLAGLTLVAAPEEAHARDGYRWRKGPMFGLKVGGGIGGADLDVANELTGLEAKRQMGVLLGVNLGAGYNERLVLGAEGNLWARTVYLNDVELSHQQMSFLANGNLFLWDGIYADGGVGLAYASFDAQRATGTHNYRELGLAAKVGLGFEYFVNGSLATGFNAGYVRHIYQNSYFDTMHGGLTLRWY